MFHISRLIVVPVVLFAATALLTASSSILAQPPGFDKSKFKDFDKAGKGFDKAKGSDKVPEKAPAPTPVAVDPVKNLEADLAKLKALEADILAQLNKLKQAPAAPEAVPQPPAKGPGARGFEGRPAFPGSGFRLPGFGPPAGFGLGRPGGFPGGPMHGQANVSQGIARAFHFMSADQLKDLIAELEKVRAEKLHAAAEAPQPRERPGRPGAPAAPTNEEILRKLDRLSQEIDDLRKSLKK